MNLKLLVNGLLVIHQIHPGFPGSINFFDYHGLLLIADF